MPERVAITGRDQQSRGDGPARRSQQALFRERDGRGQQVMRHPAVRDADLVDNGSRLRAEAVRLGEHGIGDRGGQRRGPAYAEFLAYSGLPSRRRPPPPSAPGWRPAGEVGDKLGDLTVRKPTQPQPGDPGPPLQFGQPLPEGAREFLLAKRANHHHRLVAQPDSQEGKQLAGGFVGPMQVLKDENHR